MRSIRENPDKKGLGMGGLQRGATQTHVGKEVWLTDTQAHIVLQGELGAREGTFYDSKLVAREISLI